MEKDFDFNFQLIFFINQKQSIIYLKVYFDFELMYKKLSLLWIFVIELKKKITKCIKASSSSFFLILRQ